MTDQNIHNAEINRSPDSYVDALAAELPTLMADNPLIAAFGFAFSPDNLKLFRLGLTDEDESLKGHIADCWLQTLQDYDATQTRLHDIGLIDKTSLKIRPVKGRGKLAATVVEIDTDVEIIDQSDRLQLLQGLQRTKDAGLRRSDALVLLMGILQYMYFEESPPVWKPKELDFEKLSEQDSDDLFGGLAAPDLTFPTLADWIRGVHPPDLSRETLDARFNTFAGIVNFELTDFMLNDLAMFGTFSVPTARKAMGFIDKHQQVFFGTDLLQKLELIKASGKLFSDYASQIKNRQQKETLHLLRIGLQNVSANIKQFLEFFGNVYTSLGYELPPLLCPPQEVSQPAPEPTVARLGSLSLGQPPAAKQKPAPTPQPKAELPPVPKPDPELTKAIASAVQDLNQHIGAFTRKWFPTTKAIKGRGLERLVRELNRGVTNSLRQPILDPMQRDMALQQAGLLMTLQQLAGRNPEEMQAHLDQAIDRRRELLAERAALQQRAAAGNVAVAADLSDLPDIRAHVQAFQRRWDSYKELIFQTWPSHESADVARRVHHVISSVTMPSSSSQG